MFLSFVAPNITLVGSIGKDLSDLSRLLASKLVHLRSTGISQRFVTLLSTRYLFSTDFGAVFDDDLPPSSRLLIPEVALLRSK